MKPTAIAYSIRLTCNKDVRIQDTSLRMLVSSENTGRQKTRLVRKQNKTKQSRNGTKNDEELDTIPPPPVARPPARPPASENIKQTKSYLRHCIARVGGLFVGKVDGHVGVASPHFARREAVRQRVRRDAQELGRGIGRFLAP